MCFSFFSSVVKFVVYNGSVLIFCLLRCWISIWLLQWIMTVESGFFIVAISDLYKPFYGCYSRVMRWQHTISWVTNRSIVWKSLRWESMRWTRGTRLHTPKNMRACLRYTFANTVSNTWRHQWSQEGMLYVEFKCTVNLHSCFLATLQFYSPGLLGFVSLCGHLLTRSVMLWVVT